MLAWSYEGGKGDPEADERDVHRKRERLHLPRLEQVLLVDGSERSGGGEDERVHVGVAPADSYAKRG